MRKKLLIESERKIKELRNAEPVFKSLEKKYVTEYEIPELENRKKVLESLRNLPNHLKTDSIDILNHSKKYDKIRKSNLEERIRNRMNVIKSQTKFDTEKYKTKTLERMLMRDEIQQSVEEERKNERLRLIQNTKHYAK